MGEKNETEVKDCSIHFVKEIMRIPQVKERINQTEEETDLLKNGPATKRESAPSCEPCKDNPRRKCKFSVRLIHLLQHVTLYCLKSSKPDLTV